MKRPPEFEARVAGWAKPIHVERIRGSVPRGRFVMPRDSRVIFDDARAEAVDFSGLRFSGFHARGSSFVDCDFSRVRFDQNTHFSGAPPQSRYVGCRFDRADLRRSSIGQARFERCTFDGAKIDDWISEAGEFIDCRFATTILNSRFSGTPWGGSADHLDPHRSVNEFRGNDFREAFLSGNSFDRGIDVDAQLWPASAEYILLDRWPERVDRARAIVARWADDHEREEALLMLRIYGGLKDQDVLFARRHDLSYPPDLANRVWAILESVR